MAAGLLSARETKPISIPGLYANIMSPRWAVECCTGIFSHNHYLHHRPSADALKRFAPDQAVMFAATSAQPESRGAMNAHAFLTPIKQRKSGETTHDRSKQSQSADD